MNKKTILIAALVSIFASCSNDELDEKGFQISARSKNDNTEQESGLSKDSLLFETKPSSVLLTGVQNVRIATIFKVNYDKDEAKTFIGSNTFHHSCYKENLETGNNWNSNLMPGFEAVYGYNMVNVSHYDIEKNKQTYFFEQPVLIRTVYFPSFSNDTLNHKPISRNYFMVTVYNDDTNGDGFINLTDLRRMYLFDIHGNNQKTLIPENYSVFKSECDSANDLMYVFAQLDANKNGKRDDEEPVHIFG